MPRPLFHVILAFVLLAPGLAAMDPGARAQVTTDQLNKLSLEALTAPPPGSGHVAVARRSFARRPMIAHRRFAGRHTVHVATRSALYRGRPVARHTAPTRHGTMAGRLARR